MKNRESVVTVSEINLVLDELLKISLLQMEIEASEGKLDSIKINKIFAERSLLKKLKEVFKEKDIND